MKKLFLSILIMSFFMSGNIYANPNNPTNEWLKDKTVNDLTQNYGYKLFSVTEDGSTALYTLTRGKVIIGCLFAPGNPYLKFYCFLP